MEELDFKLVAAIIAAIVSLLTLIITLTTKNFLEKKLHILKLEADHQFEQRKKIKSVLAKYKIHLINSCESLNHRMWNFANNHSKQWLNVNGDYDPKHYYITSFTYRILAIYFWISKIGKELIFLDSTISTRNDLYFIKYLKLFKRTLTDVQLYDGLYEGDEYIGYPNDHFYNNEFEALSSFLDTNSGIMDYEAFKIKLKKSPKKIKKLLGFFDGLSPNEDRLRWERLHALNLVLILFLNSFGYDFQSTTDHQIKKVIEFPRKSKILKNFIKILQDEKLENQKEAKKMIYLIKKQYS